MKTTYLFLANGFEEIEALTVVDILRRAGIEIKTVSVTSQILVEGAHHILVHADTIFEEVDFQGNQCLILPGGGPGTKHLGESKSLLTLLQKQAANGGEIAAICAAPSILGKLGLLKGKKATCYPGFQDALIGAEYTASSLEIADNIITANGPASAIQFALTIVEKISGKKVADEISDGLLVR